MSADAFSRLRSVLSELVKLDAIPELALLKFRRARIVGQDVDRVSLQLVDRDGELPDAGQEARQPIWYGVPGVSATHTPGQEVVLAFAGGDSADPLVFLSTPRGQPGHVPIRVRHEATTEILFVPDSAGIVRAGPSPTQPVARAPAVQALITALQTFAGAVAVATTVPQIAAAASTLQGSLAGITGLAATRLEAS